MEPKKTSQNKNNWNIFFFWGFLALELYWVPSLLCEFTTLKLLTSYCLCMRNHQIWNRNYKIQTPINFSLFKIRSKQMIQN